MNDIFVHDMSESESSVIQAVKALVDGQVLYAVCTSETEAPIAYVRSRVVAHLLTETLLTLKRSSPLSAE